MNWTGGGLQRHSSTSRKGTAGQLQKQHFARVQQNLRARPSASRKSPAKFSVFGIDIRDRERLDQKFSSPHHGSDLNRNKETRPSRITMRLPPPVSGGRHTSRPREHEIHRPQRSMPIKKDTSQVPDDDLYNATPPPRAIKRKRDAPILGSDIASVSQRQEGRESVSEIKRRLLRRGDWVGVTIQRPLQLAFGSAENGNDIARRRKVTEEQRAKYRSTQSHMESPFLARNRSIQDYGGGVQHIHRNNPSAPDVRISIGGRTVPPGVSSSIGRGRGPSTAGRRSSRAVSSEILLLDKQSSQCDDRSQHRSGKSEESSLLLGSSSRAASYYHLDAASQSSYALLALSGEQIPTQDDSDDQDQGWAGVTADSLAKLQRSFQKHPSPADTLPSRSHKKLAPAVDNRRSLRSGQEIFSSSSASIHHPRPQSSRRSVLLREGLSQAAESNRAQLGNQNPTVSSSQLLQNKIWRTWVSPRSEGEEDDGGLSDYSRFGGGISPGISMAPPARLPSGYIPDDEVHSCEELLYPDQLHAESGNRSSDVSHDDASSQWQEEGERGEAEEDSVEGLKSAMSFQGSETYEKGTPSNREETFVIPPNAAKTFQDSGLSTGAQELDLPPLGTQVTHQPAEDPDEVWRNFVFGSNDEPDSPDARAADHKNISEIGPSSIIAQPSSGQGIDGDFQSNSPAPHTRSKSSRVIDQSSGSLELYSMAQQSQVRSSPARGGRTSMHASNGSVLSTSSELAPTTRAVHARSPSSISQPSYTDLITPQKKFELTKPRPFIGRHLNLDVPLAEEPVYIGRGPGENIIQGVTESKRKRGRNELDFSSA